MTSTIDQRWILLLCIFYSSKVCNLLTRSSLTRVTDLPPSASVRNGSLSCCISSWSIQYIHNKKKSTVQRPHFISAPLWYSFVTHYPDREPELWDGLLNHMQKLHRCQDKLITEPVRWQMASAYTHSWMVRRRGSQGCFRGVKRRIKAVQGFPGG